MSTTRLMTADELLLMPHKDGKSDCRLELIRGELRKMSPSGGIHGIVCVRLAAALLSFVEANNLGEVFGAETGFLVEKDPDSVLGADAAFVSRGRFSGIQNIEKFIPFAPDLAVEVLSPSNTVGGVDEKIDYYFAAGAQAVWIVNPRRRTVTAYSSPNDTRIYGEQDTLDGGNVLPGFSYDLSGLFKVGGR